MTERIVAEALIAECQAEARRMADQFGSSHAAAVLLDAAAAALRNLAADRERIDWLEGYAVALYRDDGHLGRLWRIDTHRQDDVARADEVREAIDDAARVYRDAATQDAAT